MSKDISRRSALVGALGTGTIAMAACSLSEGKSVKNSGDQKKATAFESDIPELPASLLVNRERATYLMNLRGIDALICSRPKNIYYLTNFDPYMNNMGISGLHYAVLPKDPAEPPILISSHFAYYLGIAGQATSDFVDVRLFSSTAEGTDKYMQATFLERLEMKASPTFLPKNHGVHETSPRNMRRRSVIEKFEGEIYSTAEAALTRVIKNLALSGKKVAVDDASTDNILRQTDLLISTSDGENLIRDIRLQKTPEEIKLARFAAQNNAEAGLIAAKSIRDGATFQEMRVEYRRECAERLLTPSFMAIDNTFPASAGGRIDEGRSFLIDCVSEFQGYHGDYGRTVCVGEPTKEIKKATKALGVVWDELLPKLRPGLLYSDIRKMAAKTFSKTESDAFLFCNPHSVGINHTDEPGLAGVSHWKKDNLELVEGMILSVDMPILDEGLGGTGHLEDLVLITANGAELLNDSSDRVIVI